MDLQLLYATFPDRETAERLGREMLEARLAACFTFWEGGTVYWWDGALEEGAETLALFKTTADKVGTLREALAEAHPYDVPCLLPLEVSDPHQAYALWVGEETGREAGGSG